MDESPGLLSRRGFLEMVTSFSNGLWRQRANGAIGCGTHSACEMSDDGKKPDADQSAKGREHDSPTNLLTGWGLGRHMRTHEQLGFVRMMKEFESRSAVMGADTVTLNVASSTSHGACVYSGLRCDIRTCSLQHGSESSCSHTSGACVCLHPMLHKSATSEAQMRTSHEQIVESIQQTHKNTSLDSTSPSCGLPTLTEPALSEENEYRNLPSPHSKRKVC